MCNPTAIAVAGFAIQAGSSLAEMSAQTKAANANRAAALADERLQNQDLSAREIEEQRASSQQSRMVRRQTAEQAGMGLVSAAGSGVSGISVDMLLDAIQGSGAEAQQTIQDNEKATLDQITRQRAGIRANTRNRIAGVQPGSPLLAGLKIGASGLGLAGTLKHQRGD